jgi:vancomycin resistance protein VanW
MFAGPFKPIPRFVSRRHVTILGLAWNRVALVLPLAMLLGLLAFGGAFAGWLAQSTPKERVLASFSTSLKGRTRGQKHNARLAARSLDNRVIPPQGVFSFNQTVRSWSVDGGYSKALVSYDGELVRAYGGGVCQTSTTLYNVALLAGLPILERHPHVFVPGYIAPGRDAAVAYPGIDLRFQNSNPYPLRIRARVRGDRLEISILGTRTSNNQTITTQSATTQSATTQSATTQSATTQSATTQSATTQASDAHATGAQAKFAQNRSVRLSRFSSSRVERMGAPLPLSVRIESQVLSISAPQRLTRVRVKSGDGVARRSYLNSAGATGYRVVTHRVWSRDGIEVRREFLGDDTYPAMNRVLALIRDAP